MASDDDGPGPRRLAEVLGTDPDDRSVPIGHDELEAAAEAAMDPAVRDFVVGGAGSSETVRENREAFHRHRLLPRVGRDVSSRDLSVELLGHDLGTPLLLAPIGGQSLLHPEGEAATARAAASLGVPVVLSTVSTTSMEAVAEAMGDAPRWFQLYWLEEGPVVESLVERAERAGYSAIVLTMDTPVPPWREATLARSQVAPPGFTLGNFLTDPVLADRLPYDPESNPDRAMEHFQDIRGGQNVTWADVETLSSMTDLPVLVKGLLRAEDAELAVDHGADGVVVSNHGGRQVDGSVASIDALPAVAEAVGDDAAVVFDSGVRRGADVLKAMALGADAVLLGRPYLYGLGLAGETGVREVVENVTADLDLTLGMMGYADVSEVDRSALAARPED